MIEEKLRTNLEGIPTYESLEASAQVIRRMVVVLCPDENCSRTATIERQEDGSRVTRFHSESKKDVLTQILVSMGHVRHEPCPDHQNSAFTETMAHRLGSQVIKNITGVIRLAERKKERSLAIMSET